MLQTSYSGEASHSSEHFVQSALDAMSAHLAVIRSDGVILGVNTAWRRFADDNGFHDPQYGIGTNYLAVCDRAAQRKSSQAAIVARGIRDVINDRLDEFYLEYPCHTNKEKRWFVMRVTRFAWKGELRLIIAHQNVTEFKMVQVELQESRTRLQTILDNVINGIITLDEQGKVESVNPAAGRIFDREMAELFGQDVRVLMGRPHCSMKMKDLLALLQNHSEYEITGQRRDGTTFPMYMATSAVYLGRRKLYTAIIQDLSERKRMERELVEKEKLSIALEKERELRDLKDRFIAMMSHELRTPLASILLSSDMLKHYGDRVPAEEKLLYLNNISTQVEYLTEMIRDVLTISRGEAGKSAYEPEMTDLVTYCGEIVDEFRLTHHTTHDIQFVSQQVEIWTLIDRKLMRHVLNNLLSNALKYSPEGGQVLVKMCEDGASVQISVTDSGVGIPEEDQARLFEPFHRAGNVTNMPGTGLGLSIARQAIELHDGSINLESRLNEGTTISLCLPIRSL